MDLTISSEKDGTLVLEGRFKQDPPPRDDKAAAISATAALESGFGSVIEGRRCHEIETSSNSRTGSIKFLRVYCRGGDCKRCAEERERAERLRSLAAQKHAEASKALAEAADLQEKDAEGARRLRSEASELQFKASELAKEAGPE